MMMFADHLIFRAWVTCGSLMAVEKIKDKRTTFRENRLKILRKSFIFLENPLKFLKFF